MDAGVWIAVVAVLIAGGSLLVSWKSLTVAREAKQLSAGVVKPVFKVDKFRADDRFTWISVRNINTGIATDVRIGLVDDPTWRVFNPSRTPGMWTGIAEKDAVVTEGAPIGRWGWDSAGYDLDRGIRVRFTSPGGEVHTQVLALPFLGQLDDE